MIEMNISRENEEAIEWTKRRVSAFQDHYECLKELIQTFSC